ncbi:hypothetical protein [Kitasatospora sp. Ki12]
MTKARTRLTTLRSAEAQVSGSPSGQTVSASWSRLVPLERSSTRRANATWAWALDRCCGHPSSCSIATRPVRRISIAAPPICRTDCLP